MAFSRFGADAARFCVHRGWCALLNMCNTSPSKAAPQRSPVKAMKRSIFTFITGLMATAILSSCLVPGEYRIYRVANAKEQRSPGCYPDGMIPESEQFDSTSFKSGATFAIYAADSDVFYLDTDAASVEGKKTGMGAYEFKGELTDIEPFGGDNGQTQTTQILTIKVEKSGRKIKGTTVDDVTVVCAGDPNCPPISQCRTEVEFEGAEVTDVELQHGV